MNFDRRSYDGNLIDQDQTMYAIEYLGRYKRTLCLYGGIALNLGGALRLDSCAPTPITDAMLVFDHISHDPIKLIIHSPGGYVDDGLLVCDTMQSIKSPVWTIGRSCQSMAVLVLSAGEPGHRYVYPHTRTMLHAPEASAGMVTPKEGKMHAEELDKVYRTIAMVLKENGAHKTVEEIMTDLEEEFWLDAQGTIDYGLADNFVGKDTI